MKIKLYFEILTIQIFIGLLVFGCNKDERVLPKMHLDLRDGKTYQTIQIGNQTWMAENLNFVTDSGSWACDSISLSVAGIGRLYNWKTACKACPDGWHLPSDDEWKELEIYLGMNKADSDKAGRRGTNEGSLLKYNHYWFRDRNGTNKSGFSALPAGYRRPDGLIENTGDIAFFWSSTEHDSSTIWCRELYDYLDVVTRQINEKENGFSVRCLQDQ